jgi:hypothetical protein
MLNGVLGVYPLGAPASAGAAGFTLFAAPVQVASSVSINETESFTVISGGVGQAASSVSIAVGGLITLSAACLQAASSVSINEAQNFIVLYVGPVQANASVSISSGGGSTSASLSLAQAAAALSINEVEGFTVSSMSATQAVATVNLSIRNLTNSSIVLVQGASSISINEVEQFVMAGASTQANPSAAIVVLNGITASASLVQAASVLSINEVEQFTLTGAATQANPSAAIVVLNGITASASLVQGASSISINEIEQFVILNGPIQPISALLVTGTCLLTAAGATTQAAASTSINEVEQFTVLAGSTHPISAAALAGQESFPLSASPVQADPTVLLTGVEGTLFYSSLALTQPNVDAVDIIGTPSYAITGAATQAPSSTGLWMGYRFGGALYLTQVGLDSLNIEAIICNGIVLDPFQASFPTVAITGVQLFTANLAAVDLAASMDLTNTTERWASLGIVQSAEQNCAITNNIFRNTGSAVISAGANFTAGGQTPSPWSIPEHVADSKLLTGDSLVDLFQIVLNDNVTNIYLHAGNALTWQGKVWESLGIKISGVMNGADEEVSRPTLAIMNPSGFFSSFVAQRKLDSATVYRFRVLGTNLAGDNAIYQRMTWRVMRVTSLNKTSIQLQLREDIDGPMFTIPARCYQPPDFPSVTL